MTKLGSAGFLLRQLASRGTAAQVVRFLRAREKVPETECPCCFYVGQFTMFDLRIGAGCPRCGSAERQRLLALAMRASLVDFAGKRVLHFAPELSVRRLIEQSGPAEYVGADLNPAKGTPLDIEAIALPDGRFDVVVASHVLEHVDDGRALREIYRVLSPGGLLVAMVPIVEGWQSTYEDASKQTPRERELHFGQFDHVRFYGADFRERVRAAGYDLSEYTAHGAECVRYALLRGEKVFLCGKPSRGN